MSNPFVRRLRIVLVTGLTLWASSAAAVIINEVKYRGPGNDQFADLFTELYGEPGLSLAGYSLRGINGANGVAYRTVDLTGGVIPADGLFVIATAGTADAAVLAARDFIANVDWQNGPGDAVLLLDPSGAVLDAVQYGIAAAGFFGEGAPAAETSDAESLSRDALATDSNDNSADFAAGAPSPGIGPRVLGVPEPGSLGLAALGLLLLAVRTRRGTGVGAGA